MSDRFHPLGAGRIAAWIAKELDHDSSIFGIPKELWFHPSTTDRFAFDLRNTRVETPIGVAAGPHTQLTQNIIVAWLCGARIIELKTVQTLDHIEVAKPCIDMRDEGYNIEWSQELSVAESFGEYLAAWVLIHVLHAEFGLPGISPGVIFDLSIGYDLQGLRQPNMRWYLEHTADAGAELEQCVTAIAGSFPSVRDLHIPARIADSVTLSTLHGCPPDEIGAIAEHLLDTWELHTAVKLNPTLIGFETVSEILVEDLDWTHVEPHEPAFDADIGYPDALTLITGLDAYAAERGLDFSIKLCNTLPVTNRRPDFDSGESTAYLSGRPLHALAVELARRLTNDTDGEVAISFAGGADAFNTPSLLSAGLRPVTTCSDLLRPGGYLRLLQYLEQLDLKLDEAGAGDLDELILKTAGAGDCVSTAARENLGRYADGLRNDPALSRGTYRRDNTVTGRTLGLFDCVEAPCTDACAVDQRVPEYMRRVVSGDLAGAAEVIAMDNPLPTILGRACHHPCEPVCLRTHLDQPLAIREIKRFVTDNARPPGVGKVDSRKSPRVAIVGAGPCGLAAAAELAHAGVQAVIFEARDRGGGMVSATIPGYRASSSAVGRDLENIAALGVDVVYGTSVGRDLTLASLFEEGFNSIVVAAGAQRGLTLGIEGEDFPGVVDGLDFLRSTRHGQFPGLGCRIAVVGGGDVAMDCARSARRLSNGDVEILYRRTVDQMPAHHEEIRDLRAEGIAIRELVAPRRAVAENGRLGALECAVMRLGDADASGRPRPVEIPGGEITLPLDTLIVAIGQRADLDVFSGHPVATASSGYLEVDQTTLETSIPGVYAGGDLRDPGPSNIVEACGDGRRIARAILAGAGLSQPVRSTAPTPLLSRSDLLRRRAHRQWRIEIPHRADSDRQAFDEVITTLAPDAAAAEAGRCLDCDRLCSTCDGVCPNRAIATYFLEPRPPAGANGTPAETRSNLQPHAAEQIPQVAVLADLCNECGNCSTFCPTVGRPWRDKPRIYFHRPDFEEETDNAFMLMRIDGKHGIQARFRGVTKQLVLNTPGLLEAPNSCHSERARRVEESPEAQLDSEQHANFVPSGDPSTHSSDSFAQGDAEVGDSETHTSVSDPDLAIMATLLRGLTESMPQLPMPDAESGWLLTTG